MSRIVPISKDQLPVVDGSGSCDSPEQRGARRTQKSAIFEKVCSPSPSSWASSRSIRTSDSDLTKLPTDSCDSQSDGSVQKEKSSVLHRVSSSPELSRSRFSFARRPSRGGDDSDTIAPANLPKLKACADLIDRSVKVIRKKSVGDAFEKSKMAAVARVQAAKDSLSTSCRVQAAQTDMDKSSTGAVRSGTCARIQREREKFGEAARTLTWSVEVQHESVHCVRAHLCVSSHKTVKALGGEDVPACLIEVSAEGPPAGTGRGVQLIRCSGSLVPRYSRIHINWLGRTGAKPSDANFENASKVGLQLERKSSGDKKSEREAKHTIAQAVLACVAAIGRLFGMIVVDLDAEDNGSGKLIQHYNKLGFVVTQAIKGFDVEMQAPMNTVVTHAPAEWLEGLIPKDFDAWGWLQPPCRVVLKNKVDPVRSVLLAADVPWNWTFPVSFPADAKLEAKLSLNLSDRVLCEVYLKSCQGEELACARGSIRIKMQALRVVGFGRSKSRAAHESIRGKLAYRAGSAAADGKGSSQPPNCTAATAVLGTLAAFGRWFGVNTVQLTSTGDTSGNEKLLLHFNSLGFTEPVADTGVGEPDSPCSPKRERAVGDPVALVASCESLVHRCCPQEWREKLPADGALSMLVGLAGR